MNKEALKHYKEENDVFGMPQNYRGIDLYPLKVSDFEYIRLFYELFAYPQKPISLQNPMVYKMSYLKFLLLVLQFSLNLEETFETKLIKFLEHITKKEVIVNVLNREEDIKDLNQLIFIVKIGDVVFTETDFNNLREIILEQNGNDIDYIETYNPDLEKDLDFIYRNVEKYTLKDQIFAFAAITKKSMNEIKEYTIFQMKNLMEASTTLLEFNMQTIPLTEVDEKYQTRTYIKPLKHRGRYDDVLEDVDTFKNNSEYFEKS
jgi:hypothetical protein